MAVQRQLQHTVMQRRLQHTVAEVQRQLQHAATDDWGNQQAKGMAASTAAYLTLDCTIYMALRSKIEKF